MKPGLRYLGYAGRAVPVSLRDAGDLGFMAVGVAAFITAVTQQQKVFIVPLPAQLTVLKKHNDNDKQWQHTVRNMPSTTRETVCIYLCKHDAG